MVAAERTDAAFDLEEGGGLIENFWRKLGGSHDVFAGAETLI